jgi:carbon starvation protein
VKNVYLNPDATGYSVLNAILSIIMLVLGIIIVVTAIKKWMELWNNPNLKANIKSAM